MTSQLHLELHHQGGVPVLVATGEVDLYSAQQMRLQGRELVDLALEPDDIPSEAVMRPPQTTPAQPAPPSDASDSDAPDSDASPPTGAADVKPAVVVLDLTEVAFVDSTGVGAIVAVLKQARAHRASLSISGANPQLQLLMRMMGLDKVIALHATAREAVGAARGELGEGRHAARGS